MVKLNKISGEVVYLNEDYIELIESNPDTLVKVHDGTIYSIQETPEEILTLINSWRNAGRKTKNN